MTTEGDEDEGAPAPVDLIVCATCRCGQPTAEGEARPGARLLDALARADLPDGVRLKSVECMSNCTRGCSIALRGDGRWTYVYGDLDAETDVETVVDGAVRYWRATDGVVPWRERPQHFRKHCIARIPPLETVDG